MQTLKELIPIFQGIDAGEPWQYQGHVSGEWKVGTDDYNILHIANYHKIRLTPKPVYVMPLPPNGCAYHNPDDVPLSKVPDGWRFTLPEENDGRYKGIAKMLLPGAFGWSEAAQDDPRLTTYIVPSDTPFPERKPAWKLPDPPAGREWHKSNCPGDKLVALPGPEWRLTLEGELIYAGDMFFRGDVWDHADASEKGRVSYKDAYYATTRPLPVKPEPAYIDLEPDDIPQGAEFQDPTWNKNERVSGSIWSGGITYVKPSGGTAYVTWEQLNEHGWLMRPINGVFSPCRKEAV